MSSDPLSAAAARPAPTPHLAEDATAERIAATAAATWTDFESALAPIIGPRGVAALGQRSLHLVSTAHPWLAAGQPRGAIVFEPARLWPLLATRQPGEAASASHDFMATCHDLLSSLIGPPLTERLLREVWPRAEAAPPTPATVPPEMP